LSTITKPEKGLRFMPLALLGALLVAWLGASPAPCRAELVDRIVAVVNDDIILLSDFEKAVTPFRERLKQSGYSDARIDALLESERSAILEQLVVDKLTDQQARRHGIVVGEAELDSTIERIKQMNNMSDEELLRMLRMEGMTYETYREHLREQLLRSRIVNREVRSRIVITDEAVRAHYEENRARYAGQTQYHLRHILMRVPSHSQAERVRILGEMKALYARLQKGESFDRLARSHSQAATAGEGGDLGLFESRLLAEPVRDALQGLAAGQFTPVVETEQGYQIFYVEDVVHSGGRSLEEMKPEIQEKLYAEMVDQRFEAWLAALRQRAHIQIIN
jgi:peptidyl-prolyl cis-trans isomerase SurA